MDDDELFDVHASASEMLRRIPESPASSVPIRFPSESPEPYRLPDSLQRMLAGDMDSCDTESVRSEASAASTNSMGSRITHTMAALSLKRSASAASDASDWGDGIADTRRVLDKDARMMRYCFTVFDPDDNMERLAHPIPMSAKISYCVFQLERCPNSGRPHAQGYLELTKSERWATVKSWFTGIYAQKAHLEAAIKDGHVCTAYCTKDRNKDGTEARCPGTEPFKFGCVRKASSDDKKEKPPPATEVIIALLNAGVSLTAIERDPETPIKIKSAIARNFKWLNDTQMRMTNYTSPPTRDVYSEVWIGAPGVGKSEVALTRWKSTYSDTVYRLTIGLQSGQTVWFEDYERQPVLLLDDFDGTWMQAGQLVQILDKYRNKVSTKGGKAIPYWVHVIVISNSQIDDWWNYRECKRNGIPCACSDQAMASIKSRVCRIRQFTGADRRPEHRALPFPADDPAHLSDADE